MATGGRGSFRDETRTTRLERLHGPKGGHSGPRVLSPEETGEAPTGGAGRARAVSARAVDEGPAARGPVTLIGVM